MTDSKNEGTQLTNVTLLLVISCQNRDDDSRTSSLITTAAPPPTNGSSVCSSDASNEDEMSSADRSFSFAPNCSPSALILFARLVCSTTTAFGIPVEPEV